MNNNSPKPEFIYTYAYSKDEHSLCYMEMRSIFGVESECNIIKSSTKIDPSRSPFIKERIEVIYEGDGIADIIDQVRQLDLKNSTFKIILSKINDLKNSKKIGHEERRKIARDIGLVVEADANFQNPDYTFGVITLGGRWYFGKYKKSEAIWLRHLNKPREYSTALSTRVARSIVNIAVPNPEGVKVIDPCCGIGTVLVEARSMGVNIVGRDINPSVVYGAIENIAYFDLDGEVTTGPISEITDSYDVAIIDMPYNLFTHSTPEDQLSILKDARRIAKKVVVISIDTIDHMIKEAELMILDRCVAKKGMFIREVLVCE
ncbi:TRM11 family SAM-dependent methyltransferase [Metabacillus litoralis]|uniref:TRM11 family SAM-dependent methyltransferase n=1 Tax=Metabacillus litoralis TaxID=152268 RepID=UPI001CFC62ED|nr:methyltransferase domain-containing protein [Metabacillus litoralis]